MKKIGDNILLDQQEDVSIIYIRNNLSYQTADELREAYGQIQDDKILMDLGQVRITTSRGMGTVIGIILDSVENNQKVCLCNISRPCINIIEAMQLLKHVPELKIVEALDEGMEYLRKS
jgi:anti-anti-sigma regulatory factor